MSYSENLVWMDLEMTGLDPEVERIIEIATLITDSSLNIIAEGPVLVITQPQSLFDRMDDWNTEHHTASGLLDRIQREGVSEAQAQAETLDFISCHVEPGKAPLCGNSIGQDRRFLVRYMASLEDFLHYRSIDVSTVKELAARWRPDVHAGVVKKGAHRAIDDIRESVAELKYYREHFFKLP
ncbi:MAG: oligoribonuclease [Pseudomonadales bacterium]|nr:oligoribonuclease [Pseudomonadales bacterium]